MKALSIFTITLLVATLVVILLPLPSMLVTMLAFMLGSNALLGVAFMAMASEWE